MPVDALPPGEVPTKTYPLVLITGRILQHYNCGAQTRRTGIMQVVDTDVLEMHAVDASRLNPFMFVRCQAAIFRVSISLRGSGPGLFPAFVGSTSQTKSWQ